MRKENKETQKKLEEIADKLQKSNENLEQFAYAISHDLQEPLRTTVNYCQLLQNNYYDITEDKKQKFIQAIYESNMRMSWMIKDLLEYSKVDFCNKPLEEFNVGEIIKEVAFDFVASIQQTDASIQYKDMPIIKGIKVRIKQLFSNIISNALKFKGSYSPKINISYYDNKNEWVFCVADNGIGIDPRYHKRIFGIFKRLYTEDEYTGTGIGLAICKKIIENHKGRIWVDSEIGKGSMFYFSIPKELKNDKKIIK